MASGFRELPLAIASRCRNEWNRRSVGSELRRHVLVSRKSHPQIFALVSSMAPSQVSGRFFPVHGRPFHVARSSQLGATFARSAISSIAAEYRKDWHSQCISLCRGNACNADDCKGRGLIVLLACQGLWQSNSETTGASAQRNNGQSSFYYWKSESVADTAQFLTLFCKPSLEENLEQQTESELIASVLPDIES